MGRAQVGAARLGPQLSLDINACYSVSMFAREVPACSELTFLEKYTFEERVLVSQHQTLVGSRPVSRLEVVEVGLMDTDSLLELLDVLGASLAKSSLCLTVTLLAFLRGGVDLWGRVISKLLHQHIFLPFLFQR